MPAALDTALGWVPAAALAAAAALPLFLASTVFFDFVHWVLHAMLRSRSATLRALAWPHAVHHRWLDEELRSQPAYQRANLFCHVVPEYGTHLAFSAALLLALPPAAVAGCVALQTAVFLYILSQRGLDVNHRPIAILDAYRPSLVCMPAYHALHHVFPDAHFSSYLKLLDYAVGGGAELRGRRFALAGAQSAFRSALRDGLSRAGAAEVRELRAAEAPPAGAEILVLCSPPARAGDLVERFLAETGSRRLPPEVWAVHERPDDPLARHYYRDVRVIYRVIALPGAAALAPRAARRTARLVLFFARRGFNYVPTALAPRVWLDYRGFRRTRPLGPAGAPRVRSRAALGAWRRPPVPVAPCQ